MATSADYPAAPRPSGLLLDGVATRYLEHQAQAWFSEGTGAGVPTLRRALEALRRENPRAKDETMRLLRLSPMA